MAESLLSFNYSGLPTRLKSSYVSRITNTVSPVLSSNEFISKVLSRIDTEQENIKKATTRSKASSYTKIVLEKDKKRDAVYAGVLDLIKSKKNLSENPDIIRACEVLLHIFRKLGKNVTNQSYSRENVLLKALFKELEGPEAVSAINTLGIGAEIKALIDSQDDFEKTVSKKDGELSTQDGKKSIDAYRSLNLHFNALMEHIRYNIELGESPFTELTFPLNQIIAEANRSAGLSETPDKDQDSEEKPEETETVAG